MAKELTSLWTPQERGGAWETLSFHCACVVGQGRRNCAGSRKFDYQHGGHKSKATAHIHRNRTSLFCKSIYF